MHSALQSILTQQTVPDKQQLNGKNGHKQWLLDAELCVQDQVVHSTLPFSPSLWKALDAEHSTYLELPADGSRLYGILSKYVIHGPGKDSLVSPVNSFCVETNQKNTFFDPANELNVKSERNHLTLGIGLHELNFEGHKLRLLHQIIGKPVGTNCSAERYRSLVVFAPRQNGSDILKRFCDTLVEWDERITEKVYRIYSFNTQRQYWRDMATKLVRPVDSVILPSVLKDRILKDVDNFVAPETAKWYYRHGISYKRTYLFYGPPGAGKSSFIRVLAGHLGKNLCFLQPANPGMTDEALQTALQQAPENSIIVIEDIDALFAKDRKSLSNECPLTFSGLLNALDGVCNKDGQLFILTTNYIDRLDSALIRPGRVDQRVEFPNAKPDQIRSLFLHFYNGEEDCADKFTAEIVSRFSDGKDGVKLSMAALQQHFIICRTATAQEAVANLSDFEGFGSD